MPFKIERVEIAMVQHTNNVVDFVGSHQKLHGAISMLRAHVKARHVRFLEQPNVPDVIAQNSQDWVDKIDTIDLEILADGMVCFKGERPVSDYYRILPV